MKSEIKRFLEKWTGEKAGKDFQLLSGKQGLQYSEYSHGKYYIGFDGSALYDLFQGYPNWNFHTAFNQFLTERGYYFEQGNSWNCNIYKTEGGAK
jgi:hypothetical protein